MSTKSSKVQQSYNQWNDSLYNDYKELFQKATYTIWDGVISPVDYAGASTKVMILNREPYDEDIENSYDLSKEIRNRIKREERVFQYQTTLRTHLKQYLVVLDMGHNGFIGLSNESVRERAQATDYYEFIRLLNRAAYCNVKKSDGKPKSNIADLREYAKKGLDILKKQILFFNPSIILAGDVCDGVLDDLFEWGDNLYQASDHRINIWQLKIGDKLFPFVDMFHPSRIKGMSEYYLELLHALQEVERAHPGFRLAKQNNSCFKLD